VERGVPACRERYLVGSGRDDESVGGVAALFGHCARAEVDVIEVEFLRSDEEVFKVVVAVSQILHDAHPLHVFAEQLEEDLLVEGGHLQVAVLVHLLPEHYQTYLITLLRLALSTFPSLDCPTTSLPKDLLRI
jgi:hypothetical protein